MGEGEITVAGRRIGFKHEAFVVAEIGHNHQGSAELCCEMIKAAAEAGASAVKLQKRSPRDLYTRALYDRPVTHEHAFGSTYGEHRAALELSPAGWDQVTGYAQKMHVPLFATAFDFPSADFLAERNVPAFKVASGDCTNLPLLRYLARFGKPLFISTGGASLGEVRLLYDDVASINSQICLLQCTILDPTRPEEMNLRVIETYRREFGEAVIGLSDHHGDPSLALVAYGLGARVFEKHFTLNRDLKGTDQVFSLTPRDLGWMVASLQTARLALGDGKKLVRECEEAPYWERGKGLYAAHALERGERLRESSIAIKSPAGDLKPYFLDRLLGRRLRRSKGEDEPLGMEDVE